MYACPNCGANIKFDPATQKMKCSYCDTMISPHDYMHAKGADEEKGVDLDSDEYEVTYYTCPQCGGELITEDTTAATFCSYCGSSTILEMRVGREKKPNYIIPFKKTREECEEAYKKTLRKAIFAPNDLRKDETVERFRGIYMPYWIYDAQSDGEFVTHGSTSTRRGDYIYTKHYSLQSRVSFEYSGISYDASSSFEDRLSEAIAPFDLAESDHFTSSYLSGFYADTSDVPVDVYTGDVNNMVMSDMATELLKVKEYPKHGVTSASVLGALEKRKITNHYKLGMFPVWFLANQQGDRVSYAVVNGQTGKVAMDIPIDIRKYFIGVALLAIPLCVLMILSNILIGPKLLIVITLVISLIVLINANKQANNLFARELLFGDKGYNSKKTEEQKRKDAETLSGNVKIKKAKMFSQSGIKGFGSSFGFVMIAFAIGCMVGLGPVFAIAAFIFCIITNTAGSKPKKDKVIIKAPVKEKIGVIIFPIISLGVGGLIFLINPVNDIYYYATAIVAMIMTGYTVVRLVARHNMLASRKLPQFNKRGGEEHENDR